MKSPEGGQPFLQSHSSHSPTARTWTPSKSPSPSTRGRPSRWGRAPNTSHFARACPFVNWPSIRRSRTKLGACSTVAQGRSRVPWCACPLFRAPRTSSFSRCVCYLCLIVLLSHETSDPLRYRTYSVDKPWFHTSLST